MFDLLWLCLELINLHEICTNIIKAEYLLFHIVYVTQLFFMTYDSFCKGATHMISILHNIVFIEAVERAYLRSHL